MLINVNSGGVPIVSEKNFLTLRHITYKKTELDMKLLRMILLAAAMLVATGCEEQFEFNEDTLAQTIWKGHYKAYNALGDSAMEWYDFTVQFTTSTAGKYIDRESNVSYFGYEVEDQLLTFEHKSGTIDLDFFGSWIVHNSSKEVLELVRYQPNKELITLTREY